MGEDRTAGGEGNNVGRAPRRVTIREAAGVLKRHPNTVRNRVKAGMYTAEKVHTENGPTWMIEYDSLINNAPTSASQQGVSGVPVLHQEAIQELAKAIVREAGISREDVQRLERDKAWAEFHRTMALLNTAVLAGIAATTAFLPTPLQGVLWLGLSVGYNIVGLLCSLFALLMGTSIVGAMGRYRALAARHPWTMGFTTFVLLALTLGFFLWFAIRNLQVLMTTPGGHGGSTGPKP